LATYNFDTITAEQAARFNPATDVLTFTGISASDVGVTFGNGNIPSVSIFANGRGFAFPAAAYTVGNFIFSDASTLSLGSGATDAFGTVTLNGAAAFGGAGTDSANFSGRDVFLQGNSGVDTLTISGSGFGTVFGGMDNDVLTLSGTGSSFLNGNMGSDSIVVSGSGDNSVYGGADADGITVSGGGANFVSGDLGGDTFSVTGGGDNTVFGGDGSDSFTVSGAGSNFIHGNAGTDTISVTGGGDNSIYGGQGNDAITLGTGSNGDNFVSGDLGDDTITFTSTGSTTVFGGDGADTITGAGTGAATINGNIGDDLITLNGSGADTVGGGQGDDTIDATAGSGNKILSGDLGNDSIIGGAGADTIIGGPGVDVLTGGAGNDRFDFTGISNASTQGDVITDFTSGSDKIDFGSIAGNSVNFSSVTSTGQTYDLALAQANAAANGVVTYIQAIGVSADYDGDASTANTNTGSILFADTNGDGTIDSAIRLSGVTTAIDPLDIVA